MVRENIAHPKPDKDNTQYLFNLVFQELLPWLDDKDESSWQLADISTNKTQTLLTIHNATSHQQFTALICCLGEPEILAVSCSNKHFSMLNPYIDGPERVEPDLDSIGCWQILNIVFKPEKGVDQVRFERDGNIMDAHINEYGFISIIDWNSNKPISEYLSLMKDNEWREPVISLAPYSAHSIANSLAQAYSNNHNINEWKRWLCAGFVKLGILDYKNLENGILAALEGEAHSKLRKELISVSREFTIDKTKGIETMFLPA